MLDRQPEYKGELAIQLDDAKTGKRVWRGVGTTEARVTLDGAATDILKKYP